MTQIYILAVQRYAKKAVTELLKNGRSSKHRITLSIANLKTLLWKFEKVDLLEHFKQNLTDTCTVYINMNHSF